MARDLGGQSGVADPGAVFDLGDSQGSDVARNKHRYVADAVESGR